MYSVFKQLLNGCQGINLFQIEIDGIILTTYGIRCYITVLQGLIKIKTLSWCKRHNQAIVLIAVALITATQTVAVFCVDKSNDFSPSYSVITGWHTGNGKYFSVAQTDIEDTITIYSKSPSQISRGSKMIIYSQGLNITVGTKGKEIHKEKGLPYPTYCFVSCADIPRNAEIFLRLESVDSNAKILSPVYLTSKNDYIFSKAYDNKYVLLLSIALFFISFMLINFAFYKIKERPHYSGRFFHCSAILILLSIVLILKTEIPLLLGYNSEMLYTLYYTSYMLLPVSMGSLFLSYLKRKPKIILYTQIVLIAHLLIRVILSLFGISLARVPVIYPILLIAMIGEIIFFLLKDLSKRYYFSRKIGVIRIYE